MSFRRLPAAVDISRRLSRLRSHYPGPKLQTDLGVYLAQTSARDNPGDELRHCGQTHNSIAFDPIQYEIVSLTSFSTASSRLSSGVNSSRMIKRIFGVPKLQTHSLAILAPGLAAAQAI